MSYACVRINDKKSVMVIPLEWKIGICEYVATRMNDNKSLER